MKNFIMRFLYKTIINKIFNPFLDINIKPMELKIDETDKCLVIAPHPDDESIGCGGILSLYPKNFEVVCLTHGNENSIREAEMQKAMATSNIKFKMLDLKDKKINQGFESFKNIDISNFDIIFIPYIFDQHKDHKSVSLLLDKLIKTAKHKKNLKIAFYEVWSTINMPNYYVDISQVMEQKAAKINAHTSQIATKEYASKILGLNSYRGLLKNLEACECFCVLDVKDFSKIIENTFYDI